MKAGLERLADLVRQETGIFMRGTQLNSLEAALARLAPGTGAADFLDSGELPRDLLDRLIDEVTIKETFFFRQRDELDAIDWRLLLDGARADGSDEVRVWVAACASGDEAYTLAILACEAFGSAEPPVSIVATDISGAALEHASRGRYKGRSLRLLEAELRARYFAPSGDGLVVDPRLRRLVDFRRHNLVCDPAPAPERFELIACRNVLIYFDGETVERVIAGLEEALAPDAVLVLGAADRLCGSARRLASLDEPTLPQRRGTRRTPLKAILRRPLGREHQAPVEARDLTAALAAANRGDLDVAIEITSGLLAKDALDADAYFVRGLAELGLEDSEGAVSSLRRALYVDPSFGLAAFQLARAHEQQGDLSAAGRAYEQALRTLDPDDTRHEAILDQVDLGDVAAACSLRLTTLKKGSS